MEIRILLFKEVISGRWSSAGNFLGECKDGDVVHIYDKQMKNLGYQSTVTDSEKYTDVVLMPLFVLAYNKRFINKNKEHVVRLTEASIFKTYNDLIEALLSEHNLDAEIEIAVEKRLNELREKENDAQGKDNITQED